jgi:hypothetical protein
VAVDIDQRFDSTARLIIMVSIKNNLPLGMAGWAVAGLLGLATVASHAQNQQPAGGSVARFQVFSDSGRVFRLDTETGETTIYREGTMQGNQQYRYNYWQHIDDKWIVHDQAEEARQAMSSPR